MFMTDAIFYINSGRFVDNILHFQLNELKEGFHLKKGGSKDTFQ